MLCKGYFVLYGHIHNQKIIIQKMPDSAVHYLVAGAYYDENMFNLAYNYVSADLESGVVNVYLGKFDNGKSTWISDNSYNKYGRVQFPVPSRLVTKDVSYSFNMKSSCCRRK